MRYKGFYVKITPDTDLHREDKDGNDICCNGFTIEVFADEAEKLEIDVFSAAVDFTYIPNDLKEVTPEQRETLDKMIERLEEFDDVQTVYTNMKPEEGGNEE